MKPLVTLVLVYMLFSEAFQASAALQCYSCVNSVCSTAQCGAGQDRCYTGSGSILGITLTGKGCATKDMCDSAAASGTVACCQSDLCNSAEGVKMSLLVMLVPLISSIFFI